MACGVGRFHSTSCLWCTAKTAATSYSRAERAAQHRRDAHLQHSAQLWVDMCAAMAGIRTRAPSSLKCFPTSLGACESLVCAQLTAIGSCSDRNPRPRCSLAIRSSRRRFAARPSCSVGCPSSSAPMRVIPRRAPLSRRRCAQLPHRLLPRRHGLRGLRRRIFPSPVGLLRRQPIRAGCAEGYLGNPASHPSTACDSSTRLSE